MLIRTFSRRAKPSSFDGFGHFGTQTGGWPLERFRPARGVDVDDLLQLAELCRLYNKNLTVHEDETISAIFIPRDQEQEIRRIAARLAGNTGGGRRDP